MGDLLGVQVDLFAFGPTTNVLPLLVLGITALGVATGFLFMLEPGVDVLSKELLALFEMIRNGRL